MPSEPASTRSLQEVKHNAVIGSKNIHIDLNLLISYYFLKVKAFVAKDKSVQNKKIATLIRFVVVSALLMPLSVILATMNVSTTHATKAATFHLSVFISL
jgi:hypothetical protein